MRWIRAISAQLDDPPELIGSKAHGLVVLHRLDLPVPDAVVVTTDACREFLRTGRLPDGLLDELATAAGALDRVSVRSGAATSMPGMMSTILDVGRTTAELEQALLAVFSSWDTPRARTYRELHDIPHDLGTAAIVQAMVFGDRDGRSGTGVAFSRDPNTGERVPYGDVLFERRGDDVVSGRSETRRLDALADRELAVSASLVAALDRIERHLRDACYVEFTHESGRLWFLQVRPGRFAGRAAVRVATDLADEGLIGRHEALVRVTPHHLDHSRSPRIALSADDVVLGRGVGACPGVASGQVATTSDAAVRLAADGPVLLVRPETSPLDLRGLVAAGGVVTARGGPASHAAVVARAMGKPAVVGAAGLTIDDGSVTIGGRTVPAGTVITIDGTTGEIVLGRPRTVAGDDDSRLDRLLGWADDASGDHSERTAIQRLRAAHAALHAGEER